MSRSIMGKQSDAGESAGIERAAAMAVSRGIGERLQRDHPVQSGNYPDRLQTLLEAFQVQDSEPRDRDQQ